MKKDPTLQSNIQFLAIDFTNFRKPITLDLIEEETKQEIIKYLKEIYPDLEIKQNTIEELESQGLAIKGEGIKDGIIIFINKTPELIEEDKATISFMKYRGSLGAYFVDYELKYENNN